MARDRAVEGEIGVDLVGEQRKVVAIGDLDAAPAARRRSRWRPSDCSDRSRPAPAWPDVIRLRM